MSRNQDVGADVRYRARRRRCFAMMLGGAIVSASAGLAHAVEDPEKPLSTTAPPAEPMPSTEELLKRMQMMEQRIQTLEGQLKEKEAAEKKAAEKASTAAATPAGAPGAGAKTAGQAKQQGPAQPGAPAAPGTSTTTAGATPPKQEGAASSKQDTAWSLPPLPSAAPSDTKAVTNAPPAPPGAAPQSPPKPEGPTPTAETALWHLPPLPGGAESGTEKPILGVSGSPVPGLSIGAYGEIHFGAQQNPAAGGQWQNGFDMRRMVLLPTYAITPNIIFNAEIEFEHGGSGFDADDKLHGTAEIEQMWIDFKMVDQFNWRAPGVDLIPIGYINQHHEPTEFYSVRRPELYNGLIPSTWKAGASSFYGTIADGLNYQVQASAGLEDFGDDFALRTDANTVPPFPTGYGAGIDGITALGFSQAPIGDFRQLNNSIATAAKLDYTPPFWPGFAGSVSGYYTPNTTPRGAYDQFGNTLGTSSLTMFDTEFRYRIPNTGWEFRGEYVWVTFGNPANLRANNDGNPFNNVGKTMYGTSGEVAYHVPLGMFIGTNWEAVPFFRYTYQNLQTSGFAGTDINSPTGAGNQQFFVGGLAVFPSPQVVLKLTYTHLRTEDAGLHADSFLGGVGFFF